jgi:hypothetical protein
MHQGSIFLALEGVMLFFFLNQLVSMFLRMQLFLPLPFSSAPQSSSVIAFTQPIVQPI